MTPIREAHAPLPQIDERSAPERPAPTHLPGREAPSAFAAVMQRFSKEADRGEATVHRVLDAARHAVPLDPASLLALQAGIYRYGETMDLAARIVDKVSGGAKTILQGS